MYIGYVDDIFRIADMQISEENAKNRQPRYVKMPTIDSNPNIEGPLRVTQEFKDNWKREKERIELNKKKEEKQRIENKLLRLFTRIHYLKLRLEKLSPRKYKNVTKISNIRIKIKELENEIEEIQTSSGIKYNDIDNDSPLKKLWINFTKVVKKVTKKIKKFINKHIELIDGILVAAVSTVSVLFFNMVLLKK
jgi:hypothetical protein